MKGRVVQRASTPGSLAGQAMDIFISAYGSEAGVAGRSSRRLGTVYTPHRPKKYSRWTMSKPGPSGMHDLPWPTTVRSEAGVAGPGWGVEAEQQGSPSTHPLTHSHRRPGLPVTQSRHLERPG